MRDPIFKHAQYCSLSKKARAGISTELVLAAIELFNTAGRPIERMESLGNWEAILTRLPESQRSVFYTLLLDTGAKFSDGSDGIVWGCNRGLRYHEQPAFAIAELRQRKDYAEKTRASAAVLADQLTKTPKERRAFLAHLEQELRRNETRIAAQCKSSTLYTRAH